MQEGAPKKPQDVAAAIISALPHSDAIAEKPTMAGAGFINIKLRQEWISERIRTMLIQVEAHPRLLRKHTLLDQLSYSNLSLIVVKIPALLPCHQSELHSPLTKGLMD